MKDEKWFKEACYQYAQTTGTLVNFIERIYTQGRADQNEADVMVINGLSFELIGEAGADAKVDTIARIRAAGPEEK